MKTLIHEVRELFESKDLIVEIEQMSDDVKSWQVMKVFVLNNNEMEMRGMLLFNKEGTEML